MNKPPRAPFLTEAIALVLVAALAFVGGAAWKAQIGDDGAGAAVQAPVPLPPTELTEVEKHTIRLFEQASPSVVNITSIQVARDFWTRNVMEVPQGTGTGFLWDGQGHVVTNFHVIQGASAARVTLADRSTWPAELVGTAPEKDLAVLKIQAPAEKLRAIARGGSANLRVGQSVLAIGNPFGLDQSLTTGVISALGREITSVARIPIRDAIQTDAAINPGNSGGPLLDSSGRLIGVNTAIIGPMSAGIGFAIPVDAVNWVVPELIAHGRVRRPTLGVEFAPEHIQTELRLDGPLVLDVRSGSGAARAGIQPTRRDERGQIQLGDVIVGIDGTDIESAGDVILALERRQPGETVAVTVTRDGRKRELRVVLDPFRE